jgi:hypothetical protein
MTQGSILSDLWLFFQDLSVWIPSPLSVLLKSEPGEIGSSEHSSPVMENQPNC